MPSRYSSVTLTGHLSFLSTVISTPTAPIVVKGKFSAFKPLSRKPYTFTKQTKKHATNGILNHDHKTNGHVVNQEQTNEHMVNSQDKTNGHVIDTDNQQTNGHVVNPLISEEATFIWTGDFNMIKDEKLIKDIVENGWRDLAHEKGMDLPTLCSAGKTPRRIDYIFSRGSHSVMEAKVPPIGVQKNPADYCEWAVRNFGSDHLPVNVTISL